jgi:Domain of unknown function (DUF4349)
MEEQDKQGQPEEQIEAKKPRKLKKIFLFGLGGIVLIFAVSMLVGIFSEGSSTNFVFSRNNTPAPAAATTAAARPVTAAITAAPMATTAAAAATTAAARPVTAAATTAAASAAQGGSVGTYNVLTQENDPNRMIIRNATIALVSNDVYKTLNDIRAVAISQQGIIFSSNSSLKGDLVYGTIVLQVPVQAFDETMAQLRTIAYKVQNETSSSQDVTEEYADAESQVRNLRVTEQQYLKLMEKAGNVNDIITVQNQLTDVRNKIERLQGRMNFLQKKSDYSTITINVEPYIAPVTPTPTPIPTATPVPPTPTPIPEWNAGETAEKAWTGSVKGLQKVTSVAIFAGAYAIWVLPICGVLFIIGWFWWRRTFPRKPKYPQDK